MGATAIPGQCSYEVLVTCDIWSHVWRIPDLRVFDSCVDKPLLTYHATIFDRENWCTSFMFCPLPLSNDEPNTFRTCAASRIDIRLEKNIAAITQDAPFGGCRSAAAAHLPVGHVWNML